MRHCTFGPDFLEILPILDGLCIMEFVINCMVEHPFTRPVDMHTEKKYLSKLGAPMDAIG